MVPTASKKSSLLCIGDRSLSVESQLPVVIISLSLALGTRAAWALPRMAKRRLAKKPSLANTNVGLGPVRVGSAPGREGGAPKSGAPKGEGPEGGVSLFFFSPLPPPFSLFLPLLGVLPWNFAGVFRKPGP